MSDPDVIRSDIERTQASNLDRTSTRSPTR